MNAVSKSLTTTAVIALPGVYGPANQGSNGPKASDDTLPIQMRDRVHVQGVGAGRCMLRGVGPFAQSQALFWPNASVGGAVTGAPTATGNVEVLLTLKYAYAGMFGPGTGQPPWHDINQPEQDTEEVFEGFTLQGGDVQVLATTAFLASPYTIRAVIANCVFDMRHGWKVNPEGSATMSGPYIGIMMLKGFIPSGPGGYVDSRLLIANNTFVMAQHGGLGWENMCRPQAVGVIDVSDPTCYYAQRDCDETLRGMGHCGLINNVFRTQPYTPTTENPFEPYAMLGIDAADTLVVDDTVHPPVNLQTNAFAPNLVGSTNGYFFSTPVESAISTPAAGQHPDYWDCGGASAFTNTACGPLCNPVPHTCVSAALPTPAVAIYDGLPTQKDPGFVGEYLATTFAATLYTYTDWRLLPGSPLKDLGWAPADVPHVVTMANGWIWNVSAFVGNTIFDWDGEGYGNPRVIDGSPDIGFDELQFFTMAGSWANFANSHNHLDAPLDGDPPHGQSMRYMIFPRDAGGVNVSAGNQIRVNGRKQAPPQVPPAPTAWYQPPATLAQTASNRDLPFDYRTKYISFNAQVPTPWNEVIVPLTHFKNFPPLGALTTQNLLFTLVIKGDDECVGGPCTNDYFNTQAVLKLNDAGGPDLLWSNMQAEHR